MRKLVLLLALTTVGPVSPLLFLGWLTIGVFSGASLSFVGRRRGQNVRAAGS